MNRECRTSGQGSIAILNRVVRKGLTENIGIEEKPQGGKGRALWISEGRAYQAEGIETSKTLRLEYA